MTQHQKPMQVAELTAPRQFRVVSQWIRDPGPGEVQVRVQAVGICGSDLHAYSDGGVGEYPNVYPMVLGHEPVGTVTNAGPGVTGWSPGDHAALEPGEWTAPARRRGPNGRQGGISPRMPHLLNFRVPDHPAGIPPTF